MARPLRFSERKRLAETGSLGDQEETASQPLRNAIWLYLGHAKVRGQKEVVQAFDLAVADSLGRHFGNQSIEDAIGRSTLDDFLDSLEILAEEGVTQHAFKVFMRGAYRNSYAAILPQAVDDLNDIFDRHRFGFRFDVAGQLQAISSPLLHEAIVGPALLAVAKPGWDQVDRTYREAVLHQRRSDEQREALTAAAASVEAALKAAGYKGATLGALASDFRRSPIASGYSPQIVEHISELLEQLMAWRSHSGSAHGKPSGSEDPPIELVALAIHWAGAFIAYLASASSPE